MNSRTFSAKLVAAALLVAYPGIAAAQPSSPAPGAPPVGAAPILNAPSSAYVLGRDDVIMIGLLGRSDFGGRTRVQADGTIQLPFVGKMPAADRTTDELAGAIGKALKAGGYFADPVVTIEVVEFASRYVTVLGAVGSPGLIPINRPYRLSEILARVGGVREGAADYLVVRSQSGGEKRLFVRDLATGDLSQDPFVTPGDKIYAPAAETYYIYGQVGGPGVFPVISGMTVRMALARSGGLTASGSDKKIEATRGSRKVKLKLDDKVEPGDVIVVGERLF